MALLVATRKAIMLIESSSNENFKKWLDLTNGRGVKEHGLCLVSGRKIVPEMMERHPDLVAEVLTHADRVMEVMQIRSSRYATLKKDLFKQLDLFGTDFPLLIMKVPPMESLKNNGSPQSSAFPEPNGLEVILALQDPRNLGAALRSCQGFDVKKVYLCEECANPFHPESLRSSSGASFDLSFVKINSLNKLESHSAMKVLDSSGENLISSKWQKNQFLVLGTEGQGVPASLSNVEKIHIPISSKLDSLNASTALAIALYDYRAKQ